MRLLPGFLVLAVCDPPSRPTDGGRLDVELLNLVDLGDGSRILAGTTTRPTLRCVLDYPPEARRT